MNSASVILPLVRKEQEFQACVALIQGELKECSTHLNKLHAKEKDTLFGYQHDLRKRSYLLGRIAAKKAIQSLLGSIEPSAFWIDSGIFQFPIVKGENIQNLQVSISHCDTLGFSIAYPEAHPMGVDVERITSSKLEVILSQLTNKEKDLLGNKANMATCTSIFSIKEALSKVIKTGMMLDFKLLDVDTIKIEQQMISCSFSNFGQYKGFAFQKNEYVFSFVLPKKTETNLFQIKQMLELFESDKTSLSLTY